MPKQKINHSNPQDGSGPRFHLEVGWNRDMDVQVGIATDEASDGQHHLVDAIYGDPETLRAIGLEIRRHRDQIAATLPSPSAVRDEVIGRIALDAITGSTPFGTSVWVHPNRAEINDLIRLLRKARDAAFGSDA